MLYKNIKGQIVAEMKEGVLRKMVSGRKHMLLKPKGWGVDKDIIDKAREELCTEIRILDTDTNTVYSQFMDRFMQKKIIINRGHGDQYVLLLDYWNKETHGVK